MTCIVRPEVPTSVDIRIIVFWDVTCCVLDRNKCFERSYFIHLHDGEKMYIPPKSTYLSNIPSPHDGGRTETVFPKL